MPLSEREPRRDLHRRILSGRRLFGHDLGVAESPVRSNGAPRPDHYLPAFVLPMPMPPPRLEPAGLGQGRNRCATPAIIASVSAAMTHSPTTPTTSGRQPCLAMA